jgi:membrane protein YqaA with SNARE-associated domain
MKHLLATITAFAETLGGSGLALVAFLDSSFLSLPDVCDFQIVYLTLLHPDRWVYYTLMTAGGSLLGSYVMYALARKGGEAFLRRRFHERHIERGLSSYRRYGVLVVVLAALLPPPMPFKILILLAGVAEVTPVKFVVALGSARLVRYGAEALLAVIYGERVAQFLRDNISRIGIWLGAAAVLVVLGVALYRRRRAART